MKKQILLLALISLSTLAMAQTISRNQLRGGFLAASQRRSALDSFESLLEKNGSGTAQEQCYLGMCHALRIQYISGMWAKYKMLDKSRANVNSAIDRAPNDTELRFIRFMLEHNIPAFLGLSKHMNDDLDFIFSHTGFLDEDAALKKMALEFIISSKRCTPDQRAGLEKELSDLTKKVYAQR